MAWGKRARREGLRLLHMKPLIWPGTADGFGFDSADGWDRSVEGSCFVNASPLCACKSLPEQEEESSPSALRSDDDESTLLKGLRLGETISAEADTEWASFFRNPDRSCQVLGLFRRAEDTPRTRPLAPSSSALSKLREDLHAMASNLIPGTLTKDTLSRTC